MLPLLVFLLYWVGMLWIASIAMREGDLARLEAGMDYDNRLCGVDRPGSETGGSVDLKRLPYVYFACLVYGQRHPTVCVDECPPLSGHYVRWYNGSNINCKTPRGISIPATTYPTTTMGGKCVPSAASLYALVAGDIDDSAFLSVLAGVYKTLRWTLAACGAAAVLAACWLCAVRALCKRGRLAPVTIGCAIGSLLALALTLLLRAYYLGSAAFAEDMPALQGSLEVAVNTDMSVGLAILVFFLALTVTVALWCGLLQRLLQAGGILAEAAEAAASKPSLVVLLPLLLMAGLALLFGHGRTVGRAGPRLGGATAGRHGFGGPHSEARGRPPHSRAGGSAPQMPLTGRGPGATPRQGSPKLTDFPGVWPIPSSVAGTICTSRCCSRAPARPSAASCTSTVGCSCTLRTRRSASCGQPRCGSTWASARPRASSSAGTLRRSSPRWGGASARRRRGGSASPCCAAWGAR